MTYVCSVCKQKVSGDMMVYVAHTENHVMDLIKRDHPDWIEKDGLCAKCADYYRGEIKGSFFKDADCAMRMRKTKGFVQRVAELFQQKKGSK